MTLKTEGFDATYIFRVLSDFWDGYKERDQLAALWGGMCQVIDDMYLQTYQADFGKSLETVPVYWRYSWANFVFDNWISNEVFHRHLWMESATIAGTVSINLDNFFTPPETAGQIRFLRILLDGIVQQQGVDYQLSGNLVTFTEPLTGGRNMMIQWIDVNVEVPYHTHKTFAETLIDTKSDWTDVSGDAFDPAGQGPYNFEDPSTAPIEIWINGVRENNVNYITPSSVLFQLNVTSPPTTGDWIVMRWVRLTSPNPNPHIHFKYNYTVSNNGQKQFPLPFSSSIDEAVVYINGVMQKPESDYTFDQPSILEIATSLVVGDLLEVELWRKQYRWRHEVDNSIVSAPILQNGIDKPTIRSLQGVNHSFANGWLHSDNDFAEVWAPNLWVDEYTIYSNFGSAVNFVRDQSDPSYLYSTRGIWYVYWHGAAVTNIEVGGKIIIGIPVSPADTKVIRVSQGTYGTSQVQLELEDLVFDVPSPLMPIVSAGQNVKAYQALANGVTVWDYINNPEWYKYIPGWHSLWGRFSVSGEDWVGCFDDRGYLDDHGFFDDAGGDPDIERDIFEKVKYFLWILLVDSSLIKTNNDANDLIQFADTIKPAYTNYLALVEHTPKDYIALRDSVTLTLSGTP
jgi:hypothetical protein